MIVGRGFVLLVVEQALQRVLLLGTALQHQQHTVQRHIGRERPDVELRLGQGVDVPF